MNEVLIMQPNSTSFYLGESMCSLDVNTTLKFSNKSASGTVTGKKIVSSIQVPVGTSDKSPPEKIFSKRPTQEKPAPRPQQVHLKSRPPSNKRTQKAPKPEKKPISTRTTFAAAPKHRTEKLFKKGKITPIEIKAPDKSFAAFSGKKPKMKKLIKSSLKREKLTKVRKAKEKKGQDEMRELKRLELQNQNMQIRHENTRFRKIKLKHKFEWGVDQSRIRDPRSRRNSQDKSSRKARSTERVRTGIDAIREIQQELNNMKIRSRTLSQKSDAGSPKKPHQPDPKVTEFMKCKEAKRKEKKKFEKLQKFAEDSRKFGQLHNLDLLHKLMKSKNRPKRSKRKLQKSTRRGEKEHSDEELKNFTLIYEAKGIDHSDNELSYRGNEKRGENERRKAKSESDIGVKIVKVKEDFINKAVVKIQANVRRFLVKRRIERQLEYDSEDEQIKGIMGKGGLDIGLKAKKEGMKIETPLSSGRNEERFIEVTSKSALGTSRSMLRETEEKKSEYQEKLREQLILREAQLHSLEHLRKKEMQDIKFIAENAKNDPKLAETLTRIIDKRYSQLSALFEESVKDAEKQLISEMNTEEREDFINELEQKREELSNLIEKDSFNPSDFLSPKNADLSENRPAIYHPKAQISILSPNMSELHSVPLQILSPQKDSIIQESTIRVLSSEEDIQESLNPFADDFQVSESNDSSFEFYQERMRPISPNFNNNENSLEVSGSFNQHDLPLDQFFETGQIRTPDYLPERPSAPLTYFDNQQDSPEIYSPAFDTNHYPADNSIDWMSGISVQITPKLVVRLAEEILLSIISDQLSTIRHKQIDLTSLSTYKIRTDPEGVLAYLDQIFTKASPEKVQSLLKAPLVKRPLEVLLKMQEFELGLVPEPQFIPCADILNVNLYLSIENQMIPAESPHDQLIQEADHIHHKMIFDAANESLQKRRPFGLQGVPMPWSQLPSLIFPLPSAAKVFSQVRKDVEKWSRIQACKIPSQDFLTETGELNDEMLQNFREDKLAVMMIDEILEKDASWQDFEFEEAQVKIDLSDMALELLCVEVIALLGYKNTQIS